MRFLMSWFSPQSLIVCWSDSSRTRSSTISIWSFWKAISTAELLRLLISSWYSSELSPLIQPLYFRWIVLVFGKKWNEPSVSFLRAELFPFLRSFSDCVYFCRILAPRFIRVLTDLSCPLAAAITRGVKLLSFALRLMFAPWVWRNSIASA